MRGKVMQLEKLAELLRRRQKRVKQVLHDWEAKPKSSQNFGGLLRAVKAANSGGSKFKQRAQLVRKMMLGHKLARVGKGTEEYNQLKSEQDSQTCAVM